MDPRQQLLESFKQAEAAGDTESAALLAEAIRNNAPMARPSREANVEPQRSFLLDQASKRWGQYADWISRFGAAQFGGMLQDINPGGVDPEVTEELKKTSSTNRADELGASLFGYQGIEPKTEGQRWQGLAAQAVVDPANVAFVPARVAVSIGKAAAAGAGKVMSILRPTGAGVTELGLNSVTELTAIAGAEALSTTLADAGIDDAFWAPYAVFGAGLAAGLVPGLSYSAANGLWEGTKNVKNTLSKGAESMTGPVSDMYIGGLLREASERGGKSYQDRLKAIIQLQESAPDLVIPYALGVGNNAIISRDFERLIMKDSGFAGRVSKAVGELNDQFNIVRSTLIGDVGLNDIANIAAEAAANNTKASVQSVRELASVEGALDVIVDKYRTTDSRVDAVRQASDNLVKAARTKASAVTSPLYDKALNHLGPKETTMVPKSSVEKIWNAAKIALDSDVFGQHASVINALKTKWQPKQVTAEAPEILGPRGEVLSGGKQTTIEIPDVSIEDLDSLKKALNDVIGSATDPAVRREAGNVKAVLWSEVEKIDPDFFTLWQGADNVYANLTGIPMNAEGFRAFDAARFDLTAVNRLTDEQGIKDFLSVVGEEGVEVVQSAFVMKMARELDRVDDPDRIRKFINRHREALDTVPGVRQMLSNDADIVTKNLAARQQINDNYNEAARIHTDGYFKALTGRGLPAVGGDVLRSISKRRQYLSQINQLSAESRHMALTGLKSDLLQKAMAREKGDGSMMDFITANKAAYDDVFGPAFHKDLSNMALLFDMITGGKQHLDKLGTFSAAEATMVAKTMGFTLEEFLGTLRNQVMSPMRKTLHLGMKTFNNFVSDTTDAGLQSLYMDQRLLKQMGDAAAEAAAKLNALKPEANMETVKGIFVDYAKAASAPLGAHITDSAFLSASGMTIDTNAETRLTDEERRRLFHFAE